MERDASLGRKEMPLQNLLSGSSLESSYLTVATQNCDSAEIQFSGSVSPSAKWEAMHGYKGAFVRIKHFACLKELPNNGKTVGI